MIYRTFLRPLMFRLDAEGTHERLLSLLEWLAHRPSLSHPLLAPLRYEHPTLTQEAFGLGFSNPLGLAAGFDKNGRAPSIWPQLGFGFAEIGTVTALPQPGNPRPRLFRLPQDGALINRFGFNNQGAEVLRRRLASLRTTGQQLQAPLGINIGKSAAVAIERAPGDYLRSLELLFPYADYFAINVSSPNTPGLRELQRPERLRELIGAIQEASRALGEKHELRLRPVLLKIAPDLTDREVDDILDIALDGRIAGIIATNTTISRQGLDTPRQEVGGLSGCPLRTRSTDLVRKIYQRTEGKLAIVGVGGVFSAQDAYEKMKAGASLIQVYTGLVYEGPFLVRRVLRGLVRLLRRDGLRSVAEAVGAEGRP